MSVRTTVVGSWWPPDESTQDKLRDLHAGKLSDAESEAVLNSAAERAITEQRGLGLDEWTGGEYFTDEFLNHMQHVLSGVTIDVPSREEIFDYDDFAHARIDGEIGAPNGMGYATAYERERELPGGVPKATVVGPLEMTVNAVDQVPQIMAQLPNLNRLIRHEIDALAQAGCSHVQLDVPGFSSLISAGVLDADQAAQIVVDCFEGVSGIRKGIHICSGNMRGRPATADLSAAPWVEILERLDGVIDVAHLAVHYFPRYLERDAFSRIPQSIELAAGIVDEGCYWVEPTWKIRERAADWARVVGEERLWLAPSCGFGRHPVRDIPVLQAKIENMVEAASTL